MVFETGILSTSGIMEKGERKEIKISAAVHEKMSREAGEYHLSHKAYVEASILYFVSRKLNPAAIREGEVYKILEGFHKGIERVIKILIRQERDKTDLILESLKGVLHEQINARILAEVLIQNVHQLSDLDREELEQLIKKNALYMQQRKQAIERTYGMKETKERKQDAL